MRMLSTSFCRAHCAASMAGRLPVSAPVAGADRTMPVTRPARLIKEALKPRALVNSISYTLMRKLAAVYHGALAAFGAGTRVCEPGNLLNRPRAQLACSDGKYDKTNTDRCKGAVHPRGPGPAGGNHQLPGLRPAYGDGQAAVPAGKALAVQPVPVCQCHGAGLGVRHVDCGPEAAGQRVFLPVRFRERADVRAIVYAAVGPAHRD